MKIKVGKLKQNTLLHTLDGLTIRVEGGTEVRAEGPTLRFNPDLGIVIFRVGDKYFVKTDWEDDWHLVVFPNGPPPPWPLSML